MPIHRQLPTHVRQGVFTRVSGLGLETLLKTLPVSLKLLPKRLDSLNRYSPTLGIKQTFFMLIRSVLPQLQANVTLSN
jgi:hypothetical protein